MRKSATFISVLAFAAAVSLSSIGSARAGEGNKGFGRLQEPNGPGSWLVNHYDNRAGQVTNGPAFDDSAEVKFVGTVVDIGEVTVEQSAAWTWTTSGAVGAGPCALVYDSTRTLVRIHTHQGVSTENVSGPLTRIPGSAVNDPGGRTEFPFAANGTGANGLIVGAQIFSAAFKVTKINGDEITGIVKGGTNCEVANFSTAGGHTPFLYDFTHTDTINTVQTALEITGGTGPFAGATGTGVLVFSYHTLEPHGLLHAHIALELD